MFDTHYFERAGAREKSYVRCRDDIAKEGWLSGRSDARMPTSAVRGNALEQTVRCSEVFGDREMAEPEGFEPSIGLYKPITV
jgi:hypothetical protein